MSNSLKINKETLRKISEVNTDLVVAGMRPNTRVASVSNPVSNELCCSRGWSCAAYCPC